MHIYEEEMNEYKKWFLHNFCYFLEFLFRKNSQKLY